MVCQVMALSGCARPAVCKRGRVCRALCVANCWALCGRACKWSELALSVGSVVVCVYRCVRAAGLRKSP